MNLNQDPVELVETLDPAVISQRLDELRRQQYALEVLLHAARARRRGRAPTAPAGPREEGMSSAS
jgi:hypothetical protein